MLRALDIALRGDSEVVSGIPLQGLSAFVRGQYALLVPAEVSKRSTGVEQLLVENEVGVAEMNSFRLEPESGRINVGPGLAYPGSAAENLNDALAVQPGGYAIVGVAWSERELSDSETPASGLVRLLSHLRPSPNDDPQVLLEHLKALAPLYLNFGFREAGTTDVKQAIQILAATAETV